jgi:hypothetical protein
MKELAANHILGSVSNKEREEAFRACVDPVEHERQIAMIGEKLQAQISAGFEVAGLSAADALNSEPGRELAAALGPRVMLSQRDQFFVETIADRYQASFGDVIYFSRERDCPIAVVNASPTDGGAPMAVNPLITQKGYVTPIQVMPGRLVMTFEYDNPKLAESNASSRSKAIDQAAYQLRKAMQDLVITAWVGGQYTAGSPFPAAIKHDLPTGRVHAAYNTIDLTGAPYNGNLTLDAVRLLSDYFDEFGFLGEKQLYLSPKKFNAIKTWASATAVTDAGSMLASQVLQLNGDSIKIHDVVIYKKFQIPDSMGYAVLVQEGGYKTLGVYQFGSIQTLPNPTGGALRSKFDVVVPGIAGVNHDPIRCAFLKFA